MKTRIQTLRTIILEKISTIFLIWKRSIQSELKPYDITPKQIYVLGLLSKAEFFFPAHIAQRLSCDRPTATVILKNMERHGWITREKDPENKKRTRIQLTQEGREKRESIPKSAYRTGHTTLDPLACLTEQETEQLATLLSKITNHLKSK